MSLNKYLLRINWIVQFVKCFTVLVLILAISGCDESEDGMNGDDGLNVLFIVSDEPAGPNCSNQGTKVEFGQDINENDELESEEVQGTSFLCNGENSASVLVVTVDEPSGENCSNGGTKVLIGIDENENGILETEEVDNISFICDGEIIGLDGKVFVILSGDITDEEAADQIAREFGSNTQFVSILFTTQLTELDLSMASELVQVRIEDNLSLGTVDLSGLKTLDDELIVTNNKLSILKLDSLETSRRIEITDNRLTRLDLNRLSKANEIIIEDTELNVLNIGEVRANSILIESNELEALDLSFLTDEPDLELDIEGENLSVINLENLRQINTLSIGRTAISSLDLNNLLSGGRISVFFNEQLTNAGLSNLQTVGDDLQFLNNSLTELNLKSLVSVEDQMRVEDEEALIQLEINQLVRAGLFSISDNLNLISLSASSLNEVNSMSIGRNVSMTSLDISSLQTVSGNMLFDDNESLETLNLNSLQSSGLLSIRGNELLTSLELSNLNSSDRVEISFNGVINSIILPGLNTVNISLNIRFNESLSNLDLRNLVTSGPMDLGHNGLVSINLDGFQIRSSQGSGNSWNFDFNRLNSSAVNYLLSVLVAINPSIINSNISLRQSVEAPPFGQGLIDKAALEADRNNVSTD